MEKNVEVNLNPKQITAITWTIVMVVLWIMFFVHLDDVLYLRGMFYLIPALILTPITIENWTN